MKKLLLLILLFSYCSLYSQKRDTSIDPKNITPNSVIGVETNLSPGGLLENVFDHYGNKYKLSDIVIGKEVKDSNNNLLRSTSPAAMTCGYFNLYFEDGCGMDDASNATHLARRAVVCQVFTDLSNFINSPLTTNGLNNRVNIWVRNINNINASPNGILGLATSFYSMPFNTATGFGGVVDNEVWKTIHLGRNSYTNVVSPLMSSGISSGTSGVFYHGMMAFNFNNYNWNTNLSATSFAGLYDLYSVVLHEVIHALGFASLINSSGGSKFNVGYNYYNRYDTKLKNNANTQFLILKNTSACGTMYNYAFNSVLKTSVLHPSSYSCANDIRYVGLSNVQTFTPSVFNDGSSLSHFDTCITPSPNYVMNNSIGVNTIKRCLKAQERNTLGDLGYSLNSSYGVSTTYQGTTTYTGTISGISVAGMNDGINTNGVYSFIGNAGQNISISGILSNDSNATGFECLEDIYNTSNLSATSGTGATTIDFNSNQLGLHLLRYVPINGSQKGNITYIYVYVRTANCTPSACNILNNGGFENSNLCGQFGVTNPPPTIECWENLAQTPDLFKRGCTTGASANFPNGIFNVGLGTSNSIPATDSHNGTPNNSFVGLFYRGDYLEALQTTLSSPLQQSQQYVLSFWAKVNNGYTTSTNIPIPVNFSSFPSLMPSISLVNQNFQNVVPASIQIVPTTLVPNDNIWHFYSYTFTFDSATNHNAVGMYTGTNSSMWSYVFVDDVTISPVNQLGILNLPLNICQNGLISNLQNFLDATPFNGTFSGNGVTGNTFNASIAGVGIHNIIYTYTNSSRCTITISDQIEVLAQDDPQCNSINCPQNLVFDTTESLTLATYQAANTIVTNTNYLVNAGSTITLVAGNSITLSPSSEVKANSSSNFTARLAPCTQTSARFNDIQETKEFSALDKDKLTLYPNPTKELITISSSNINLKSITVYSIDGKLICSQNTDKTTSYQLNISNYQNGIYLAIIETEDGKIHKEKIIKN